MRILDWRAHDEFGWPLHECVRFTDVREDIEASSFFPAQRDFLLSLPYDDAKHMIAGAVPGRTLHTVYTALIDSIRQERAVTPGAHIIAEPSPAVLSDTSNDALDPIEVDEDVVFYDVEASDIFPCDDNVHGVDAVLLSHLVPDGSPDVDYSPIVALPEHLVYEPPAADGSFTTFVVEYADPVFVLETEREREAGDAEPVSYTHLRAHET